MFFIDDSMLTALLYSELHFELAAGLVVDSWYEPSSGFKRVDVLVNQQEQSSYIINGFSLEELRDALENELNRFLMDRVFSSK